MRNLIFSCAAFALSLATPAAFATADFVCVADSPYGTVTFGDAASSLDHAPLEPAYAMPSLQVGATEIDLSQTEMRRNGAWFLFRDRKTKRSIFSMRKVSGAPAIPASAAHPFCDAKNWHESCWAARLVIEQAGRSFTIERALCGVG